MTFASGHEPACETGPVATASRLDGDWLRNAIDAIPHCIFVLDTDGRYAFQNAQDRRAFGELIGRQALDICEPSTALEAWQRAHVAALRGEAVQYVSDRPTREGLVRAEVFMRPFFDGERIVGAVGIAVDQTTLLNAHEELEASRSRLADFLACSSDWVWELDADLRFVEGLKIANNDIPSPIGMTRWQYAGAEPDKEPIWAAHKADLLARRPFRAFTFRIPRMSGGFAWLEANGQPIFNANGVFLGYRGTTRDVSSREMLLERLKQAELVVRNTHNGIVICDAEHRITWVNPAFEAMSGYSAADVEGRPLVQFLHCEAAKPETMATIAAALARDEGVRVEVLNRTRSGELYWLDIDLRPVFGEDGDLDGYIAVETDITDQVALREHTQAIFENVPSCVAVFDEQGVITDCNRAVERMTGWDRAALIGLRCSDFPWYEFNEHGPPDRFQEHPVYKALREDRVIEDALVGWEKPGSQDIRWLKGIVKPIRGKGDRPFAIFSFSDISEEIATRQHLARALADTRSAVEELGVYKAALDQHSLVFVIDRQRRLTYVNKRFCETSGYMAEELIGNAIGTLINSGLHDDGFYDEIARAVLAGEVWRGEICNRRKNGELYWVEETSVPQRNEAGEIVAFVGISLDITERKKAEQARLESEHRYRLLADHSSDVIILGRADGQRTYFSPSVQRMTGYTPEEALRIPMRDWVHPDDLRTVFNATARLSPAQPTNTVNYRCKRKDGTYFWVEQVSSRVADGVTEPYIIASARDVTRRKMIENEYRNLFEHGIVGIYRKSIDGRLLRANPALVRMRGYASEAELLAETGPGGANWHVDKAARRNRDARLMQDGLIKDFVYAVKSDEGRSTLWVSETAWLVRDDQSEPVFIEGMIADVTERILSEKNLEHLARHDALTGLVNRVALREALDRAMAARAPGDEPLTMLYIDLDRFKAINDSLGHAAGDELLVRIAERLRAIAPEGAVLARFGGDEFGLLLPAGHGENAGEQIAIQIIAAVNHAVQLSSGHVANVGASIGIARTLADETDGEQTTRRADLAMYQAKRDGRNAWRCYSSALDDQIKLRQSTESGLREALAQNQFELHFQPVHRVETRALTGFEALVRWRHPERGMISPGVFIPVAEESGLIVPLGEWVLHAAFAEALRWPSHLRVAINVSVVQLRHPDFLGHVMAALRATPIAPERIEIEVTESALLDDSPTTLMVLQKLQTMGLKVALDDFGTGWSSLSYLNRHRFDRIKIDRSFVQGMADRRNEAIVRTIIDLGRQLDIEITAEGVEQAEQYAMLARMGCHEAQGYLLGRPIPAAELPFDDACHKTRPALRYVGGLR